MDPSNDSKKHFHDQLPDLKIKNQSQSASRHLMLWNALKRTGRTSLYLMGAITTVHYLNQGIIEPNWEAYQKSTQVLSPEVDKQLLQQFPDSTESERKTIARSDEACRRERAKLEGLIKERQALKQSLPESVLNPLSKPSKD